MSEEIVDPVSRKLALVKHGVPFEPIEEAAAETVEAVEIVEPDLLAEELAAMSVRFAELRQRLSDLAEARGHLPQPEEEEPRPSRTRSVLAMLEHAFGVQEG